MKGAWRVKPVRDEQFGRKGEKGMLNQREAAGATNEDNVVDVYLLHISVLQPPSREDLADEVVLGLLELGAGESLREVAAASRVDLELGGHPEGEGVVGLLDFRLELAEGAVVFRGVGTGLLVFYCLTTESMMRRCVPPAVAKTSKTPWPMDESEASKVPLPRS